MGARITIITFILLCYYSALSQAITTDSKDVQIAKLKMQVGSDTALYWRTIINTISIASTHRQGTTAKAVYDYCTAFLTATATNATLSGNGTAGSPLTIAQQSATSGQVLKWNGTTWLPAADNTGTGTVTSVSVTPTQGVTASVATATTTPNISIGLGAITPTSVAASGTVTGSNLSGTNTGNQTISYTAPTVTLSGSGGSFNIPQGDITGSGAGDQLTFFTGTKTVTGSSRFTLVNSGLSGLIIDGGNGAGGLGSYIQFRKDGTNNFIFGAESSLFGGTGTGGAIFQYGDNPFFFCTNSSKRAVLLGNGNFGIGTLSPAQLFHVNGIARITGTGSTATTITGRDANNDITNVGIGTGLSITSGTLNASGTVGGTGVANKVAYWSGTNTLTSTTNFAFDGTNLAVGAATAGGGRLRVSGNSTSVGLQVDAGTLPSFGSTIQATATGTGTNSMYGLDLIGNTSSTASNYLNRIENNGTGSTILQLNSASAGGSPFVQYNIVGGSANWTQGVDNADLKNFKLRPNADWSGTTGLTVTTAGLFGINKGVPAVSLDISGTDAVAIPKGTSAQRPLGSLGYMRYNTDLGGVEVRNGTTNWHLLNSVNNVTLTAGLALGTLPTITVNGGFETAYTVTLTVGTAPVANEIIFTRTFPSTWSSAPRPVFSAANVLTASEITKFYVDTSTSGTYTIKANGTLTSGGVYKLNVVVQN
jgi:hypothetical protein